MSTQKDETSRKKEWQPAAMKAANGKRWRVVRTLAGHDPAIVDSFDFRDQAVTLLHQLQENANVDKRIEKAVFELVDGREEDKA